MDICRPTPPSCRQANSPDPSRPYPFPPLPPSGTTPPPRLPPLMHLSPATAAQKAKKPTAFPRSDLRALGSARSRHSDPRVGMGGQIEQRSAGSPQASQARRGQAWAGQGRAGGWGQWQREPLVLGLADLPARGRCAAESGRMLRCSVPERDSSDRACRALHACATGEPPPTIHGCDARWRPGSGPRGGWLAASEPLDCRGEQGMLCYTDDGAQDAGWEIGHGVRRGRSSPIVPSRRWHICFSIRCCVRDGQGVKRMEKPTPHCAASGFLFSVGATAAGRIGSVSQSVTRQDVDGCRGAVGMGHEWNSGSM